MGSLGDGEAGEELSLICYGVCWDNYQTDGPGYAGPLYLLKGAGDPACPGIVFVRRSGKLEMEEEAEQ